MWIEYTRDGIRQRAANFSRTRLFLWVWATEGDEIVIHGYIEAPREADMQAAS